MRAGGGPFWQTNAAAASVSGGSVVVDGFDREVTAARCGLKPAGPNRLTVNGEIRTRP